MRRAFLVRVDEKDGHYRRLPRPGKHARLIWRVAEKTLTHPNWIHLVCTRKHRQFHRKDAKDAKCFIVLIKEFLCELRVLALRLFYIDGYGGSPFIPGMR